MITQNKVKACCIKPECDYSIYTIPANKSLNGNRQVVLDCWNKKGQSIVQKFKYLIKTEFPGAGCTRYVFEECA